MALPDTQWHHRIISSYDAWNIEQGDTTVIIGISDCGTDFSCPDLHHNIAFNYKDTIDGIDNDNDGFVDNYYGWNMAEGNNDPQFGNMPHGNFVTGMCSATGDNGFGGAGVALKCKYLPIKVEKDNNLVNTYESIVYAADHRCNIVNCSWGSASEKDLYGQDIVNYATFNQNCLVISAAGNENNDHPYYPAALDHVISVASTDTADEKGSNASYHYTVDLCAPGMLVYSTLYGRVNSLSSGSSFAAPLAAGAAALIKSKYPDLTALQIGDLLKVSSDPVAATQKFPYQMGAGRLNVYKALTMQNSPSIVAENITCAPLNQPLQYGVRTDFVNLLAEADSIHISISANREGINWIDSTKTIYHFTTMQRVPSIDEFKYQLSEDFPADSTVVFTLKFTGLHYSAYQIFEYIPKSNNLQIAANEISTIMTSTGNIGYDQNSPRQGSGIMYNGRNYMSLGGIIFSKTAFSSTDNLFNEKMTLDNDFKCDTLPHVVQDNDTLYIAECYLSDKTPELQNLNIQLRHRIYAFKTDPLSKALIYEYVILNQGNTELNDLYGGIYNDWDLINAYENKIDWDAQNRFSYVYRVNGGTEVGISYLSVFPGKVYAFDNDGSNQSIKLNDGFPNYMKYNALTTSRTQAGRAESGNDVSLMNSYGPLHILAGDTLTIAFGILFGESPMEIQQTNSLLKMYYEQYINPQERPTSITSSSISSMMIYPNPATNEIWIQSDNAPIYSWRIIDLSGRLIKADKTSQTTVRCDVSNLKTGLYLIGVTTAQGENIYKICIQ